MTLTSVAPDSDPILDAALAVFSEVGVRKATIGDVAKRAGIDRVTVYRRLGSKDDLVTAVVGREAVSLFADITATARTGKTLEDRIALGFTATLEGVRGHAVLSRMLELEPDTVLPQLTIDGGPILVAAVSATMAIFDQAVEDGLLADSAHLETSAEILVRLTHSLLLTPQATLKLDTAAEIEAFARAHVVPFVVGPAPANAPA